MTQGENLSHDTLVTTSRLRDAPQYKQVIGTVDGPVRHGVVTIRMHHVLRNWGNDNMNRPDAEFVPAHQIPSLYTSAFAEDVTVITRDRMLELIADQKQLAQRNVSNPLDKFEYQLLGRLQQDCEYYLGAGNRHRKHLWAPDEALQIQKMKELYESLPDKPNWITLEAINGYEEKMVQNPIMANPNGNVEPVKVQEYASYKDLVKTPDAHVEFLRVIGQEIDVPNGTGSLYARLSSSVRVKDAPFSQAAHLTALESNSDGWDMDEVADSVKVEIAQLSSKVKGAEPGYDVPHFTTGFEWMIRDLRERGVSVEGGLHFKKEKEAVSGVDYESPSP